MGTIEVPLNGTSLTLSPGSESWFLADSEEDELWVG
jgi:hypothetical protein